MIEIININEVQPGDILLIEGVEYDNQVLIVTVGSVTEDNLILFSEMGGLDYCPEDMDAIVRIGNKDKVPVLTPLSQAIHIALPTIWADRFKQ